WTRRRWVSPRTMMWSTHSRRIDPISRSAKAFCQGDAGVMGLSRMPMARNRRMTTLPYIDPVPIADQVAGGFIPRECLCDLARNPFGRRIYGDVDPDQVPAVEPDDDQGIEQVETDRWNHEQVHGGDVWRVVMQEGPPSLAGRSLPLDHVLGNARLRDLKPKFEQAAMNTRCSPERILYAHLPDQRTQLR